MTLSNELSRIIPRVQAGVALFDEHYGRNWVWKIDLSLLNQSDFCFCVGGQLYGTYVDALKELGIDRFQAIEYGLVILGTGELNGLELRRYFEVLTTVWRSDIQQIRELRPEV